MKKLLINSLFLIISINNVFASLDKASEVRAKMWNSDNPAFNNTQSPEKWDKEPAVILAKSVRYEYKKAALSSDLVFRYYFHHRVKLNDISGVNKYREIHYQSSNNEYFGVKVIKPDGTEQIVDLGSAVTLETGRNESKKIAIPNLKEGDIIDYYNCGELRYPFYQFFYFDPVIYTLAKEFPIVEQRLEFLIQRNSHISLCLLNGAPKLQYKDDEEKNERIYFLVDKERDALKDLVWFYPYRELPTVKFRAVVSTIYMGSIYGHRFLPMPGYVKNAVSDQEILNFINDNLRGVSTASTKPKEIIKYVKSHLPPTASNIEKAKAGFYYYRNKNLRSNEISTIADYEITGFSNYTAKRTYHPDNLSRSFAVYYNFLKTLKIPFDVFISTDRNISSIENILFESELRLLFRITEGDKQIFVSSFKANDEINNINYSLLGTDAYYYDGLASTTALPFKRTKLPITSSNNNIQKTNLEVLLNDDFSKTKIEVTNSSKGCAKYLQNHILDYYDYEREENQHFEYLSLNEITPEKDLYNLYSLKKSYQGSRDTKRNEKFKSIADDIYNFKIDSLTNIKVLQTGRFDTLPELIIKYEIETSDLLNKVGKNYMMNIGKLIENQIKIEEKDVKRDFSIYLDSPRKIQNTIKLKIPQGYTVDGLENLVYNIDNAQGGFISSAKIETDYLVIETQKEYKELTSPKETWSNYLLFMNAAYNFTEQKVLLRKL